MLTVARVVEYVVIGAYLGAAHLIEDRSILTNGSATVTVRVKARHGTILNLLNGASAIPTPFDLALQPNEVLSVAGSFITNLNSGGCNLRITRTLS
jgi:hypothetical protein